METKDPAPYQVSLDPERALELAKSGGALLLLDVPPTTILGLDVQMFALGPNFKGMKMLPPGPHFLYYGSSSKHGHDASPIIGLFLHLGSSQVVVRRWDSQSETLVKIADSNEVKNRFVMKHQTHLFQEERFVEAVRNFEFDRHLGAYDLQQFKRWHQLTDYVTADVINRLEPVGGDISILAEGRVAEKQFGSPAEKRLIEQLQSQREALSLREGAPEGVDPDTETPLESSGAEDQKGREVSSARCFYTPLPRLIKTAGISASELTTQNLDKSKTLDMLLEKDFQSKEDLFLGEVQFAFIAFLMGQSLEGFIQWKGLVILMLSCEAAPLHFRTKLFTKFLAVIYFQLKHSIQPNDGGPENPDLNVPFLDVSWFSEDSFLRLGFKEFFSLVENAQPVDGDLLHQARRLRRLLEGTLGWTFYEEVMFDANDEYAPVVVDDRDNMLI